MDAWLVAQNLTDPHLRWYLDYCCRDDYGAGLATVSAWGGVHYFASRHGFSAPGEEAPEGDPVLTWPEGNAWLTRALAALLGQRLYTGQVVMRIEPTRQGVDVLALNTATGQPERWLAQRCIVALPVFVAARVVAQASPQVQNALRAAAGLLRYAPWVVTNLHLDQPLTDRGGAAPAWDNVLYNPLPPTPTADASQPTGLGYVDATHQSLGPVPGATVLTHYRALGDDPGARARLLAQPWTHWRDQAWSDLRPAHPELAEKTTETRVARYGHAMAMPVPGFMNKIATYRLPEFNSQLLKQEKLAFAHSDWSGYSVFEEAFTQGHLAV
jgi:hypothetical protein